MRQNPSQIKPNTIEIQTNQAKSISNPSEWKPNQAKWNQNFSKWKPEAKASRNQAEIKLNHKANQTQAKPEPAEASPDLASSPKAQAQLISQPAQLPGGLPRPDTKSVQRVYPPPVAPALRRGPCQGTPRREKCKTMTSVKIIWLHRISKDFNKIPNRIFHFFYWYYLIYFYDSW